MPSWIMRKRSSGVLTSLKTDLSTKACGVKMDYGMERESKSGQTELVIKATGKMTWPMAKDDSFMRMEMSTRAIG